MKSGGTEKNLDELLHKAVQEELGALYDCFCEDSAHCDGVKPSRKLNRKMHAIFLKAKRAKWKTVRSKSKNRCPVAICLAVATSLLWLGMHIGHGCLFNLVCGISDNSGIMQSHIRPTGGTMRGNIKPYVPLFRLPTYLPDGFLLEETTAEENSLVQIYYNKNVRIIYKYFKFSGEVTTQKTNDQGVLVTINGRNGLLVQGGNICTLLWSDSTSTYCLAGRCGCDEFLKMAESIK